MQGRESVTLRLFVMLWLALSAAGPARAASPAPASPQAASASVDLSGPPGSVSFGATVTVLSNGNLVVTDAGWNNSAGRVYLVDGSSHQLINSLEGSTADDQVGKFIYSLPDGDYVVASPNWANGAAANAGAVTRCSGLTGCPGAVVSAANSLVGTTTADLVGIAVSIVLTGSGYIVNSSYWDNGAVVEAGAVTACPASGCIGAVSDQNSLVGTQAYDTVGNLSVITLPSGGYVVRSTYWANGAVKQAGAVTLCPASGCTGSITAANSLVGSTLYDDVGTLVSPNPAGGYIVSSPSWSNGATKQAGAVTVCPPAGCTGEVSAANSLIGTQSNDAVGITGIVLLEGGAFLTLSQLWNNGTLGGAGAVTRCPASGCAGMTVSTANSLVGAQAGDSVGQGGAVPLVGGGYVVVSPNWSNGSTLKAGAVTACPVTGCTGVVSAANSLIGGQASDRIGQLGVAPLPGGGYVVASPAWANGGLANAGAVTTCPPAGCTGLALPSNSLLGSQAGDNLGLGGVVVLPGGNYVVLSPNWANGGAAQAGAATFCPQAGCGGPVSAATSLVGNQPGDQVGAYAFLLKTGGYAVMSPFWHNGNAANAGAATACPATGCFGTVSSANSLVGDTAGDRIGSNWSVLDWGGFLLKSYSYQHGGSVFVEAFSLCRASSCTGTLSDQNSVIGGVPSPILPLNGGYDDRHGQMEVGRPEENRVTFFTLPLAASATVITSNLSTPTTPGQSYRVVVSVTSAGGIPSGTVTVSDGSATCQVTLLDGAGACDLTSTTGGQKTITASYAGDANFAPSQASAAHPVTSQVKIYLPLAVK